MPFPVAHALIGASVAAALDRKSEARWKVLFLCALLGVSPDFDYLLNVLRMGRRVARSVDVVAIYRSAV